MPKNNSINGIHAQRLKAIRGFINFDFDLRKPLSRYQKQKIKTYYDEIDALTARPYYSYRPRDKTRLAKAQKYAQHEKSLPGLKVAFIPTNGKDKPKIRYNNKSELIVSTKHISSRLLEFDKNELIKDAKSHVEKVIKRDKTAKRFTILAGKYEIPNSYSRSIVPEQVVNLALKYSAPEANNYFGNWMVGLTAHHFHDQADFDEYRNAKMKAKVKHKAARRNSKRRQSRNKRK
jgi:hypothetical protein